MMMHKYIVARNKAVWTIRFNGRDYDSFNCEEDAMQTALQWALNAPKQGHRVNVLRERHGGATFRLHWLASFARAALSASSMRARRTSRI
jgi:hypothetical protein